MARTGRMMALHVAAMRGLPVILATAVAAFLAVGPAMAQPMFSPGELAARPGEERAGRLGPVDGTGPARLTPLTSLPPLPEALRGSIRRVDTGGRKLAALTFDLCELSDQKAGYDGAVVDALRRHGAPATFFAGGKWMRSHPERARQLMADPLFEVGSHAWTHGNFAVLDASAMARQVDWAQAQYELLREDLSRLAVEKGAAGQVERIPLSMRLFRFPYGRCRAEALEMLAGRGLAAVQWDVNMMDAAKGRTAEAMARDVLRAVRPGSIVLGHANGFGRATAQALDTIIPGLRARGYELVTVTLLLESGRAESAAECHDTRPGDTAVYDRLYGDGTAHRRK